MSSPTKTQFKIRHTVCNPFLVAGCNRYSSDAMITQIEVVYKGANKEFTVQVGAIKERFPAQRCPGNAVSDIFHKEEDFFHK